MATTSASIPVTNPAVPLAKRRRRGSAISFPKIPLLKQSAKLLDGLAEAVGEEQEQTIWDIADRFGSREVVAFIHNRHQERVSLTASLEDAIDLASQYDPEFEYNFLKDWATVESYGDLDQYVRNARPEEGNDDDWDELDEECGGSRTDALRHIGDTGSWPDCIDQRERDQLVRDGFAFEDDGLVQLTSLGELELEQADDTARLTESKGALIPEGFAVWDLDYERGDCIYGAYCLLPASTSNYKLRQGRQRHDLEKLGGYMIASYFRGADGERGVNGFFKVEADELQDYLSNAAKRRLEEVIAAINSKTPIERETDIRADHPEE